MDLVAVVDTQLERTRSQLVKFLTSLLVRLVAARLQVWCQLIAIELQRLMAVAGDLDRAMAQGCHGQIVLRAEVVALRFAFLAQQQISRQLLVVAVVVGKAVVVAVAVQQESM